MRTSVLALCAALPFAVSQSETVLGVYMFHRHGDRTPKILPPANLTDLGYRQVYTSGQYYRSRYIDSDASHRISGINSDEVLQTQIQASAPLDTVLQNSAAGFLQALYPPVGSSGDTETLRNGSTVTAPMDGYQLIPVELVESGSSSEDSSWLQSTSDCYKAELSSNEYFETKEYNRLYDGTMEFYQKLLPVLRPMFNETTANYKNAYTIWDYINVAEIHNSSIPHSDLLTPATLTQLQALANTHEWDLAYNASEPIRAIAGRELAAQIVQFLNETIEDAGSLSGSKYAVQFGAYASFASFFGLADLPSVDEDFTGVTNYASSMVFEMFTKDGTDVTNANYPGVDDIYAYPLFGTGKESLKWNSFVDNMNKFSIGDTESWCTACGNTTGICEAYAPSGSGSSATSSTSESAGGYHGNGLSPVVNGVIGAMVTLAVVLGLEALAMLALDLRLVKKSTLMKGVNGSTSAGGAKA